MPSKPLKLFPAEQKRLTEFGERLRLARLRRRFSAELVAERVGVSRATIGKAEQGSAAVSMGVYLRMLAVLHLEEDFDLMARDDHVGRRLQDLGITVGKRIKSSSAKGGDRE